MGAAGFDRSPTSHGIGLDQSWPRRAAVGLPGGIPLTRVLSTSGGSTLAAAAGPASRQARLTRSPALCRGDERRDQHRPALRGVP